MDENKPLELARRLLAESLAKPKPDAGDRERFVWAFQTLRNELMVLRRSKLARSQKRADDIVERLYEMALDISEDVGDMQEAEEESRKEGDV